MWNKIVVSFSPLNARQFYSPGAVFPQQGTEIQGGSSSTLGCMSRNYLPECV